MSAGHVIQKTGDHTSTLYCPEYGQTMHSDSGAWQEALLMHVKPSGVLDLTGQNIRVLDIGFGLGYNILALLHEAQKKNHTSKISVISLEMDRSISDSLEKISFHDSRDSIYSHIKEAYARGSFHNKSFSIDMHFGDARKSILLLESSFFNTVFLDPFSPATNPELWSVDFLKEVSRVCTENAVITTYSSALHIRQAMIEAGFNIGRGPAVGRKHQGTVASKGVLNKGLTPEETVLLSQNIKATPYRDPGLKSPRNDIVNQRLKEMKEKRKTKACRQVPQE